jgi:hypothetical protein
MLTLIFSVKSDMFNDDYMKTYKHFCVHIVKYSLGGEMF